MDRKLIEYLPPVLREVADFQAINAANEPEIVLAWDALDRVLDNQFLDSADENGVAMWEQELRIHPADTDTLMARKARIRAMWNMELPYTVPWLKNWLSGVCGPMGHEEVISDYAVSIQLDYDALMDADKSATEIFRALRAVIPSNMLLQLIAASSYRASTYVQTAFIGEEIIDGATAVRY